MSNKFLIYGANGYMGEPIAREAVKRGLKPILGGRSQKKVEPLAKELGLVCRTFALEDKTSLDYTLKEVDFVIHCAGPFSLTSEQMIEGCLLPGTHYRDMTGEWTLLYSDSSWTSQDVNEFEKQNQQQGLGIRRYNLVGDHEYQWVAYYDDVRHGLLGASLVSVLNLAWEFHGSVVYQRQSLGYSQPSSMLKPVYLEEQGEAYQALAGLTWANDSGHNVVLEYWFDSRAWSNSEWQRAIENAESLSVNPMTASLAGSYAQGYQHANLVQHNIMFHWSLDSTHGWLEDITPTFDVMLSPQDGGFIATQWLNYQALDNGHSSLDLELAARFLGGKSDSAYANLPDSHMILLNIKGRF